MLTLLLSKFPTYREWLEFQQLDDNERNRELYIECYQQFREQHKHLI